MNRDWKEISSKIAHRGGIFNYRQVERVSPEGDKRGVFDIFEFANWVNIVAITADQKLVMVEQFRHGIGKITTEIPGGAVDKNEDYKTAAIRELREETGHQSNNWKLLGQVHPNPAIMNNVCQIFLALDCEKTADTQFDPLEDIEIKLWDLKDLPRFLKEGRIVHSLVVAALQLYYLDQDWQERQ